jgi:Family of unknown function (DUF5947)
MSANGSSGARPERRLLADAVAARRRAQMVSGLRGLAIRPKDENGGGSAASAEVERCDLCAIPIPEDHRHLLHLVERRIVCACEACWAMRAGEGDYRPVGNRTMALTELALPDDLWASFQIPIGLAFFMESTVTGCVVAMYPSPGGATESELHFESWSRMVALNPVLAELEPDIEGLIANRLADPPVYVIAPIDRCYALTGTIKAHWEGISGGPGVTEAVSRFFDRLRAAAVRV